MKFFILSFTVLFSFLIFNSCAPVKFTKANHITVNPNCTGSGCSTNQIQCNPRINGAATSFTYASGMALPSISSNCTPNTGVTYTWVAKRADSSTVSTMVPGLSGENPQNVNFQTLGSGSYYVYLTASQPGGTYSPFTAATPLEFIVPGGANQQLACNPKLNTTFNSIILAATDSNPTVTAGCSPPAGTYTWTITKNGAPVANPGISGASSVPDIKSLGEGVYNINLYATLTGSPAWQSTAPLTVTVQPQTIPPSGTIACTPRINGSLTSITLTSSSPNPLISANCIPSTVQYNWNVTKNGTTVSISGLAGSNSNPNFISSGRGTYLVYLTATSPGYTTWTTSQPLEITVDANPPSLAVNCMPRLNNTAVSVTITTAGPNPLVTSSCAPSGAALSWSVFQNGNPVAVSGLSGPSSTPNFTGLGLGTYEIYLTATAPSYNSYSSPSPLVVVVGPTPITYRQVEYNKLVGYGRNKVDIITVFDDSRSMLPDNTKLAERMQGFVSGLASSNLDWQMCATITRAQDAYNNGTLYWGASQNWINYVGTYKWVLNQGAADPYSIFTNTVNAIGAGWENTDDERAIKALYWNAEYADYNHCYRDDAAIAAIIISDEDERSVGGDPNQAYYDREHKYLEADDTPAQYLNKVRQKFGADKRVSVNSIIVRPGDSSCMAAQDGAIQYDGSTSKSHYGYKYNELSLLTAGAVTSICSTDYSSNLYYFRDRVISTQGSVPLECAPVGDIQVSIAPSMTSVSTSIANNTLYFNPPIPAGRTINLRYKCAQN